MKTISRKELKQNTENTLNTLISQLELEPSKRTKKIVEKVSRRISKGLKSEMKKQLKKNEKASAKKMKVAKKDDTKTSHAA